MNFILLLNKARGNADIMHTPKKGEGGCYSLADWGAENESFI